MMRYNPREREEQIVLDQVRFVNIVLEEVRKRNKELPELLGNSYSKIIGIMSPYEEMVSSLRKVKAEFDTFLDIIRNEMLERLKKEPRYKQKKKKKTFNPL